MERRILVPCKCFNQMTFFRGIGKMIKRIYFLIIVGVIFLFNVPVSYGEFLIELRNDRAIYAENYRAEADQIVLYFKSGILRIAKDEIKSIRKGERDIEERKGTLENLEENISEKGSPNGKEGIESYKKVKKEIQERLDESEKAYFSASNQYEKDKAMGKMLSISSELFELQKDVVEKNNGIIPEWWQEETWVFK